MSGRRVGGRGGQARAGSCAVGALDEQGDDGEDDGGDLRRRRHEDGHAGPLLVTPKSPGRRGGDDGGGEGRQPKPIAPSSGSQCFHTSTTSPIRIPPTPLSRNAGPTTERSLNPFAHRSRWITALRITHVATSPRSTCDRGPEPTATACHAGRGARRGAGFSRTSGVAASGASCAAAASGASSRWVSRRGLCGGVGHVRRGGVGPVPGHPLGHVLAHGAPPARRRRPHGGVSPIPRAATRPGSADRPRRSSGFAVNRPGRRRVVGGVGSSRADADVLRQLHDAHAAALLAYARRLCDGDRGRAEDVVQETLLRAWQHPEALAPERGPVRAWLFTVARNLALTRGGRAGRVRRRSGRSRSSRSPSPTTSSGPSTRGSSPRRSARSPRPTAPSSSRPSTVGGRSRSRPDARRAGGHREVPHLLRVARAARRARRAGG